MLRKLDKFWFRVLGVIRDIFVGIHQPAKLPVPVSKEPDTHRRADATQNQKLVPDHQRR